jgi:hypothetical protein
MWIKLNKLDLPGESYILSTGEQDEKSTGVSVYVKDQMLLVGVGRGTRVKKVAITKDMLPLSKSSANHLRFIPPRPLLCSFNSSWSPSWPLSFGSVV